MSIKIMTPASAASSTSACIRTASARAAENSRLRIRVQLLVETLAMCAPMQSKATAAHYATPGTFPAWRGIPSAGWRDAVLTQEAGG